MWPSLCDAVFVLVAVVVDTPTLVGAVLLYHTLLGLVVTLLVTPWRVLSYTHRIEHFSVT